MKYLVIAGSALLVMLLAKPARAQAGTAEYAADPRNWYYQRGTRPGGGVVM